MKITFQLALATVLSAGVTLAQSPQLGGCSVFPNDNVWNARIDSLPVATQSSAYIQSEGGSGVPLHPDFGTVYNGAPNGIPYVIVPANQPSVPIVFTAYGSESNPGPYPVPATAPIEGGSSSTGDRHVLVLQSGTCMLYELYSAYPQSDGSWQAASGAVFNLNQDAPLRPTGWTSADAAGLPISPGLVVYDEVQQALAGDGVLHHALRFTVPYTQAAYLWPARHLASSSPNTAYPPMGQRFRLKANVSLSIYPGTNTAVSATNQVILKTLQQYGMFVADNGSSFFLSGAPNSSWSDDDLHNLTYYHASDFEAVDESSLELDPNSGATQSGGATPPTVTLTANPAQIQQGAGSTVSWSSTNASACTASGGWSGTEPISGSTSVSPASTTTYTLSCTGSGGSARASATVTVTATPAPTVTLTANPTQIASGGNSTLSWTSTNASTCTAGGGWSGTKPTSGSASVAPANTTNYVLSCTGIGGSTQTAASVTVTTASAPTVTLTASPAQIRGGQQSTLTWSSTNTSTCTASGGSWSGSEPVSGSTTVSPRSTTTYKLSCTGAGGSVEATATVRVLRRVLVTRVGR